MKPSSKTKENAIETVINTLFLPKVFGLKENFKTTELTREHNELIITMLTKLRLAVQEIQESRKEFYALEDRMDNGVTNSRRDSTREELQQLLDLDDKITKRQIEFLVSLPFQIESAQLSVSNTTPATDRYLFQVCDSISKELAPLKEVDKADLEKHQPNSHCLDRAFERLNKLLGSTIDLRLGVEPVSKVVTEDLSAAPVVAANTSIENLPRQVSSMTDVPQLKQGEQIGLDFGNGTGLVSSQSYSEELLARVRELYRNSRSQVSLKIASTGTRLRSPYQLPLIDMERETS